MQECVFYTHFPQLPFQHGKHPDPQNQGYMSEQSFKIPCGIRTHGPVHSALQNSGLKRPTPYKVVLSTTAI